jgi:hypothetical protein
MHQQVSRAYLPTLLLSAASFCCSPRIMSVHTTLMCSPWQAMHSNKSAFVYTFPSRTNNHFFFTGNFTCHCATGANECAACHAPTPFHGMTFPSRASKSKCRELRPELLDPVSCPEYVFRCMSVLCSSLNTTILMHSDFNLYICVLRQVCLKCK